MAVATPDGGGVTENGVGNEGGSAVGSRGAVSCAGSDDKRGLDVVVT